MKSVATREDLAAVNDNPLDIAATIRALFEQMAGRNLQPAQSEMLLINSFSYQLSIYAGNINGMLASGFVAFAEGPALDLLGQLVGVERLAPASARVRFFLFIENPTPVYVPAGTRVSTADGKYVFATVADVTLTPAPAAPYAGEAYVDAVCLTPGTGPNGLPVDSITTVLDPVAGLAAIGNYSQAAPAGSLSDFTPSGGSDQENDEELRERIFLAPNSFSVAGPTKAYVYFAKTASAAIVDVSVTTPGPGRVLLVPLTDTPLIPTSLPILNAVFAAVNPDDVRPLCDKPEVAAPAIVQYGVQAELTLLSGASEPATVAAAMARVNQYGQARNRKLGLDIVRDQILALLVVPGVYAVNLIQPAASVVIDEKTVAVFTGAEIVVTGTNNG